MDLFILLLLFAAIDVILKLSDRLIIRFGTFVLTVSDSVLHRLLLLIFFC